MRMPDDCRVHDRRACLMRLHDGPLRWLLLPAWLVYAPLTMLRNALFDHGLFVTRRLNAPVISIGNLVVGGTGKTPVVQEVVDIARALGHKPVVLSRGYGGGGGPNDEARMLDALVVCDPDRFGSGAAAIVAGATCLVLDDGFQHRHLARDLDVVLIDAVRPWGGSGAALQLPVGALRERRSALRRAGLIILTHCDETETGALEELRRHLAGFGKPIVRANHRPTALVALGGGAEEPVSALSGQAVVLASGIGNPEAFERAARRLGWDVRACLRFSDHHAYHDRDWQEMVSCANENDAALVVTAKDAVKLTELSRRPGVPTTRCFVLRMRIAFDDADDVLFQTMLKDVLSGSSPQI
jgi:tetraacyldisaccharide 4'-kinase